MYYLFIYCSIRSPKITTLHPASGNKLSIHHINLFRLTLWRTRVGVAHPFYPFRFGYFIEFIEVRLFVKWFWFCVGTAKRFAKKHKKIKYHERKNPIDIFIHLFIYQTWIFQPFSIYVCYWNYYKFCPMITILLYWYGISYSYFMHIFFEA